MIVLLVGISIPLLTNNNGKYIGFQILYVVHACFESCVSLITTHVQTSINQFFVIPLSIQSHLIDNTIIVG